MKRPALTLNPAVLLPTLAMFTCTTSWAGDVTLQQPQSGWHTSAGEKVGFAQEVHYPASSVNLPPDTGKSSIIRGHIANHPKGQPATLVVNGVAMPMRVEEDGSFQRPYAFGSGSNGVEVRSGKQRARSQFYDANPTRTPARLRVVLSWDTDMTDLDLHVVTPSGEHCFYGNRELGNGGALDVDVTSGYGPEIFASPNPEAGTYLVYINYYGSGPRTELTVAKVAIITDENTPNEKQEMVVVPMRKPGELTLAKAFVFQ